MIFDGGRESWEGAAQHDHRVGSVIAAGLAILALAVALSGCARIADFASRDAGNAAAMADRMATVNAADTGAPGRAICYRAWAGIADGVADAPPKSSGIFTGVETGIEIDEVLRKSECQAIAGRVMLWMIHKAPGSNLLPF